MQFKSNNSLINKALLIGIVLLLIEITFFNNGIIFSLLISSVMIYFGRKKMPRFTGKLLFWIGIASFILNILGMLTFKFFLIAIFIYLLIQYMQKKKGPKEIIPFIIEPVANEGRVEQLLKKKPLFENGVISERKTPEHVYEWNDINIQTAVGDTVIDLSYTVLPKGETIIFIRSLIGNLKVLVPYDVEISVNHSVIAGTTKILELEGEKSFNQTLQLQTEGYDKAEQKIKIFTSFLIGDLEVKRV